MITTSFDKAPNVLWLFVNVPCYGFLNTHIFCPKTPLEIWASLFEDVRVVKSMMCLLLIWNARSFTFRPRSLHRVLEQRGSGIAIVSCLNKTPWDAVIRETLQISPYCKIVTEFAMWSRSATVHLPFGIFVLQGFTEWWIYIHTFVLYMMFYTLFCNDGCHDSIQFGLFDFICTHLRRHRLYLLTIAISGNILWYSHNRRECI